MKYFSYIRVSTQQQDYDRQLKQLNDWCNKEKIDIADVEIKTETRTGTNNDRPILLRLIETMKYERTKDDVCLLLVEATRFGRSYELTKELFAELKKHDIKFVITTCPVLDTRTRNNNPAQDLVVDIVLNVMTWIGEEEHRVLMERTSEGRLSAKAKGVKFGRKNFTKNDIPQEFIKYYKAHKDTHESKKDLLYKINGELKSNGKKEISRATLYNYIKLIEE